MTEQTYSRAKYIREEIDKLKNQQIKIDRIEPRDFDEEFMLLRKIAHGETLWALGKLEREFEEI